ncbi:MAG: hypothetical protein OZSIB_3655 [Candidatus Ozemobacter sibiricus]|jgi:hypothetical protein|uniref:DUF2325 domain-containing protein n=1 Tax=Candidatus Ozemobacter sibiricus TaxID=2268124 RepID=A0A367ZS31_9BACT|nr:MAG: hypothetical protein OZSIB_3655 [Candidatus Ozemobacter sibiricus]
MKKLTDLPDLSGLPPLPRELRDLDRLAGLPTEASRPSSLIDEVARSLARKSPPPADPATSDDDRAWRAHKLFADLHERYGRPFRLFVGDLLDVLLGGPMQTKFLSELMDERIRRLSRPPPATEPASDSKNGKGPKVPVVPKAAMPPTIQIGGEPRFHSRSFLKRKAILAAVFLDSEEYPSFLKLLKQISTVCREELKAQDTFVVPTTRADQQAALRLVVDELKNEMTQGGLVRAWLLLEAGDFQDLEWVFNETRTFGLVRPTFYEDLDKAYREAKKMLKLLVAEFNDPAGGGPDKREAIIDYLQDILEVFTHHHFVLKHFNQTRPSVSRAEFESHKREWQNRLDTLRAETQGLRDTLRQTAIERDQALADARALRQEAQELRQKLQKLDPVEVQKQMQAMESRMNQALRERDALLEEDAELRTIIRNLDAENQQLTQKLRELKAIPDEMAKSVAGLLAGKRVVVFGGVGRDHYRPVLEEAGVRDADYEWYEGYHTISQARTAEIVGRCDVIVVITSYAGHLHTWQTRHAVGPHQTLFLIHSSGAGSLRQQILEKFKKSPAPTGG